MKKIIVMAIAMTLAVSGAVFAQETDHSKETIHHHKHHGVLTEKLNLSPEQKEQLKSFRAEFHSKIQDLKKQDQVSIEEKEKQKKELHEQFRNEISSILTSAQREKLEKMKAERKENRRGKNEGSYRSYSMEVQKELNLSTEQIEKMNAMRSDFHTKLFAIRKNSSLSKEEKMKEMKEVTEARKEKLKSLLTSEQLEKLQALKKDKRHGDSK